MKDDKYKLAVINKEVAFSSGFFIRCNLTAKRYVDDNGEIKQHSFTVTDVLSFIDVENGTELETPKGKRQKRNKNIVQGGLFSDEQMDNLAS